MYYTFNYTEVVNLLCLTTDQAVDDEVDGGVEESEVAPDEVGHPLKILVCKKAFKKAFYSINFFAVR